MAEIDITPILLKLTGKSKYPLVAFREKIKTEVLAKVDQGNPDKDEFISRIKQGDDTYELFQRLADSKSDHLTKLDCIDPGEISEEDINNFDKVRGNNDKKITIEDFVESGTTKKDPDSGPKTLSGKIQEDYEEELGTDGKPTGRWKKKNGEPGFAVQLSSGAILYIITNKKNNEVNEAFVISPDDKDKKVNIPIKSDQRLVFNKDKGCLVSMKDDDNNDYTVLADGTLIAFQKKLNSNFLEKAFVIKNGQREELFFGNVNGKEYRQGFDFEMKDGKIITYQELEEGKIVTKKTPREETISNLMVPIKYQKQTDGSTKAEIEVDGQDYSYLSEKDETGRTLHFYLVKEPVAGEREPYNVKRPYCAHARLRSWLATKSPTEKEPNRWLNPRWREGHPITFIDDFMLTSEGSSSGQWMFKKGITSVKVNGDYYKNLKKEENGIVQNWYIDNGTEKPYDIEAYKKYFGLELKEITIQGKQYLFAEKDKYNAYLIEIENGYRAKVFHFEMSEGLRNCSVYVEQFDKGTFGTKTLLQSKSNSFNRFQSAGAHARIMGPYK